MEILHTTITFFAEALILVLAIVAVLVTIAGLVAKAKSQKSFDIELLHEKYQDQTQALKEALLSDSERKSEKKQQKILTKEKAKLSDEGKLYKSRVFVIDFLKGDLKASASEHLREEISTVLGVATQKDEVVINVESPGGLVHGYGFAAAQLIRLRTAGIPLTICVDQVAASGGYLMACTADKIIASPFALIGSIGVVAQVPNFNKLLKKHDVDFKEYTAGDYKRTVSLFGEITEKGETKFKEQLEQTHDMFKSFVAQYRPKLDIAKVSTGEYWYGQMALGLGLVDEIKTSDEYLLSKAKDHQIVKISFETKPTLSDKISDVFSKVLTQILSRLMNQNDSIKNV